MIVVVDVNISPEEVDFLKTLDAVSHVVHVPVDLRRSMPDEEIVKYALEHEALIVTRDKGFSYNPTKQWKEDSPSVLLIRYKNRLVRQLGPQVRHAMDVFRLHASRDESVAGVLRRGKFRLIPSRKQRDLSRSQLADTPRAFP